MTSSAGSWPPPLVLPLWFGLGLWLGLGGWLPALHADDDLVAGLVAVDLPHDTNAITSLTPQQAERMLASFRGAEVRFTMRDRGCVKVPNGLATLSPQAALVLVQTTAWDGSLPGVVGFEAPDSIAVAAALVTRTEPLRLPNLQRTSSSWGPSSRT